jgi:tRNA(fMet)-specific endonuclease VapC
MYILDTDHLSLIQRNGDDGKRILTRLAAVKDPEVAVTIITYENKLEVVSTFCLKQKHQMSKFLPIKDYSNLLWTIAQ